MIADRTECVKIHRPHVATGRLGTRFAHAHLVILTGPTGAGKTPVLIAVLRERAEAFQFLNPDAVSLSPSFRHPPASRVFAAQTGGPSGLREQDPVADTGVGHAA